MKKIVLSLVFLFLSVSAQSASTPSFIPDDLSIREHWVSLTKSYDIETKTQKLGTLYRRFFSLLLTYDFYDPMDIKTATAQARFFSFGAHLDIFDQTDSFIGSVEEQIFTFFPTFQIIDRDSMSKQAFATMNFWGTRFYICDPATNQEMAIMSRSFFRVKNDWTIHVTNRGLLESKHIDTRVLLTVLAVQAEIEEWKRDHNNNLNASAHRANKYTALAKKVNTLTINEGLDKLDQPSNDYLEALADELDQGFKAEHPSIKDLSNEEQVQAFTSYCTNLIDSSSATKEKKKAIATLLSAQLANK
jgi:hypothetical protein